MASRWLRDFALFATLAIGLKWVLNLVIWRYSGPVSLVIMLVLIRSYLQHVGLAWHAIGLTPLDSVRRIALLVPQIGLAFVAIGVTGAGLGFLGDALGIAFMAPDQSGAIDRFGDLAGNTPLYALWVAILCIAGPAEELYFRGFMITQLERAFGRSLPATAISIVLPAVIFGLGHVYYQGLRGLVVTGGIGLTLGTLFVLYRRNVWPLMIAHAGFNIMVFTALYAGWDF